ncbi:MAG: hypothetical protein LBP66_05095 [Lactococcus lactis]|jgi:hypothetical protein|nr:hypothetical protein [Lactococcus lactis]
MNDFNQDMQNLLNAYDSNWEDYLILREQFIEKYSLSVEKLQEQLNTAKKALTEIDRSRYGMQFRRNRNPNVARQALAAIGGDDD